MSSSSSAKLLEVRGLTVRFPTSDGVVLLASVAVALATLVVDVLDAFIDPRVRYA